MVDPSPVDPFARHLAQLLSVADLLGRLQPPGDEAQAARDVALLARVVTGADRASLFQVDNADADAEGPLWVMRLARSVAGDESGPGDGVEAATAFHPGAVALLLATMQGGAPEALGPLTGDEPFYARHRPLEPRQARHAALAPVVVDGQAVGVLEVARPGDEPFSPEALRRLEAAARTAAQAVYGTRRERSVQAMLAAVLPGLLDPATAPTSLPARLRGWLASRSLEPSERQAIAVATTIAELGAASPAALELVQSVLSAARRAFVGREPGGDRALGR